MTFALPDICVSLILENGRTNSHAYKDWCRDNLGSYFGYVTPDDLYSMRCGILHNGRFGDLQHNVGRVMFAISDNTTYVDVRLNDGYIYSIVQFCCNFTEAVSLWFKTNEGNELLNERLPRLMQYRVGGFTPYIWGETVLA